MKKVEKKKRTVNTLASRQAGIDNQADAIKAGFSVLCEVLGYSVGGGGNNWLRRSALLSLACQQFLDKPDTKLPFPELVAILGDLVIEKRADTAKETQNTDFWFIKQG